MSGGNDAAGRRYGQHGASSAAPGGSQSANSKPRADLHWLCREGKVEELRKLLRKHAPQVDKRKGSYGLTALHEACRMDRPQVCLELLNYGVEFNETTTEGRFTALHLAAYYRHYRCIEHLLLHSKKRLKLHFKNEDGKTALQLAHEKGFRDVVRIIRCGEIYQVSKEKASADLVRSILERLQFEERQNGACTPSTESVVRKLIDKCLSDAASANNIQVVGYLLQFGVHNPDVMLTSYKLAKNSGFLEVAAILILSYRTFIHDTDAVRYLLAPQVEVENNNFLILGSQQERDLVYPLHSKKAINTSIAMRVAMQQSFHDTAGEILINMECDTKTGAVDWHGLGLPFVANYWLLREMHVFRSLGNNSIHHSVTSLGEWVTSLDLSVNYLRGVPPVIVQLKNLKVLDLSENFIGGADCADANNHTGLPVEIFGLKNLKKLNLRKINLAEFPEVEDWSPCLTDLNLSNNQLKTLPFSLGKASEMLNLNLSHNKLEYVPRCVGELTKLCSLNISDNHAIKSLPLELGRLSQLISLDTKKLTIGNVPEEHLGRPGDIVRYLNKQLRSLEPQRAAKIVVVGESHDRRQLLVRHMRDYSSCPPGVFDLGCLETFWLFMRAMDVKHTHFILVWDLDRDESLVDLIPFFEFIRKKLPHNTKTGRNPRLQVVLAAVHTRDVPREEIVDCVDTKLGEHEILANLRPVRPKPVIVNLTRGHRESSVKDLFNVLDTLDSTYLMIPEVPHSHVGLRNRLSSNKKLLSTPLEQTAWMIEKVDLFSKINSLMKDPVDEIAESNWDEMKALLTFLQHDGNLLHIPYPGSVFDDLYFFTPQWLFRSLLDGFGPQAHPPLGFASHTEGLYRRKALASREMFGRGSPRAKLGDFAMQLATFFGLAFPVQGDMMFLPFKLPAVMPPNLEPRFVSSIHSTPMHVRFFSASNDWPWPLGFFPLLQSYAMDNLAELTQDRTAEQPHSYTEALSWNCGQHKRADVRHARPGASRNLSRNRYSQDFELSRRHRLTLWTGGIAGWVDDQLIFSVFQKSTVKGAFPQVPQLSNVGTLCVAVPGTGQTGLRRVACLVDIVLLLLDEVFAHEVFPFRAEAHMAGPHLEQYTPCQQCVNAGDVQANAGTPSQHSNGHSNSSSNQWHLYSVTQVVQACTQKSLHTVHMCTKHSCSSVQLMEQLVPDLLLHDVDIQYRFTADEIISVHDHKEKEGKLLGHGGFAKVMAAYCEDRVVACKQYNETPDVLSNYRDIRREIEVLNHFSLHCEDLSSANSSIGSHSTRRSTSRSNTGPRDETDSIFDAQYEPRHPATEFFVSLFGICLSPMTLLLELAPYGSLNTILEERHHELSRPYLAVVAAEVSSGIRALHTSGIVSRDIKGGNVLVYSLELSDRPHVKLTDFGTSIVVPQSGVAKVIGTRNYQAPETQLECSGARYGFPVDVFAFGLFLFELMTGRKAFSEVQAGPIMAAIRAGKRPDISVAHCGAHLQCKTAMACWQEQVHLRPQSTSLHEHLTQPESLLMTDCVQFELDTSLRNAFVITPPSADFGRGQYLITVHRDSVNRTRIRMGPIRGSQTQDVLASTYPDLPGKQMHRESDLDVEGGRALSACISTLSRRLWIGTDRRKLVVVDYSTFPLSCDDDGITVPGKPLSMAASVSQIFVALDNGLLAMFPRDRRRSDEGRRHGYRALRLDDCPLVALCIVHDSRLWCLSQRGDVHILSVSRRNEKEVQLSMPLEEASSVRGLTLCHAAYHGLVWVAYRDSFHLVAWLDSTSRFSANDASASRPAPTNGGTEDSGCQSPALIVDMSGEWRHIVPQAQPLLPQNIELDENVLRVRSLVVEGDVMWVGTSVGIVLLYRLKQAERVVLTRTSTFHRRRDPRDLSSQDSSEQNELRHQQPEFLGWLYTHSGPTSQLMATDLSSTGGFSGRVVMSCGTGCPLFDQSGCFALSQGRAKQRTRRQRFQGIFTASSQAHDSVDARPTSAEVMLGASAHGTLGDLFGVGDDETDSDAGSDAAAMPVSVEAAEDFAEQLRIGGNGGGGGSSSSVASGYSHPTRSPRGHREHTRPITHAPVAMGASSRHSGALSPGGKPPGTDRPPASPGRERESGSAQGSKSPAITVARAFAVDVPAGPVATTTVSTALSTSVINTGITFPPDRSIGMYDIEPVNTSNTTPNADDYIGDAIEGVVIAGLPGSGGVAAAMAADLALLAASSQTSSGDGHDEVDGAQSQARLTTPAVVSTVHTIPGDSQLLPVASEIPSDMPSPWQPILDGNEVSEQPVRAQTDEPPTQDVGNIAPEETSLVLSREAAACSDHREIVVGGALCNNTADTVAEATHDSCSVPADHPVDGVSIATGVPRGTHQPAPAQREGETSTDGQATAAECTTNTVSCLASDDSNCRQAGDRDSVDGNITCIEQPVPTSSDREPSEFTTPTRPSPRTDCPEESRVAEITSSTATQPTHVTSPADARDLVAGGSGDVDGTATRLRSIDGVAHRDELQHRSTAETPSTGQSASRLLPGQGTHALQAVNEHSSTDGHVSARDRESSSHGQRLSSSTTSSSSYSSSLLTHKPKPGLLPLADVESTAPHAQGIPQPTHSALISPTTSPAEENQSRQALRDAERHRPVTASRAIPTTPSPPSSRIRRHDSGGSSMSTSRRQSSTASRADVEDDGFILVKYPTVPPGGGEEPHQDAAAASAGKLSLFDRLRGAKSPATNQSLAVHGGSTSAHRRSPSPGVDSSSTAHSGDDNGPFPTPMDSLDQDFSATVSEDAAEKFVLLQDLEPVVVFWEACNADTMEKLFAASQRCHKPFGNCRRRRAA